MFWMIFWIVYPLLFTITYRETWKATYGGEDSSWSPLMATVASVAAGLGSPVLLPALTFYRLATPDTERAKRERRAKREQEIERLEKESRSPEQKDFINWLDTQVNELARLRNYRDYAIGYNDSFPQARAEFVEQLYQRVVNMGTEELMNAAQVLSQIEQAKVSSGETGDKLFDDALRSLTTGIHRDIYMKPLRRKMLGE